MTRDDMKIWVLAALKALGGKAFATEVAKYIWHTHEAELRKSGAMLYTWQYDARWAATALRKEGKLKAVNGRRDMPWELA